MCPNTDFLMPDPFLVAYASPETGHQMRTIEDVPELAKLRFQVPEGKYLPARCSKTRTRPDDETLRSHHPLPGGSLLEFQAHTLVRTTGSSAGSNSSSPELSAPAGAPYGRVVTPASMTTLHASISSPMPICPSSPPPPATVIDRPPVGHLQTQTRVRVPLLSVSTCLPKIDVPPPHTRPDPEWVLQNCVAVSPVTGWAPARRLLDDTPDKKGMAPLVYTRQCPYMQRHPMDNYALRALDAMQ
jgi:Gti1/Pac2 family transcription factor